MIAMSVACASRFSVLKLEDDEFLENESTQSAKASGNLNAKNKSNAKNGGSATENKTKPKKKKKAQNDVAELQSLVFGNSKKNKGGNQAPTGQKPVNAEQWEEWKSKDKEYVSETYEQDLQQALLLSKIDFEKEKETKSKQPEGDQSKPASQSQKKKKKTNQKKEKGIMSLDEFQSSPADPSVQPKPKLDLLEDFIPPEKGDFFNKIEEDAVKIIIMEQRHDTFRERIAQSSITSAEKSQFQETLNEKEEEITHLKQENEKLKEELKIVKTRNKKLYGILATGEMREKAEILVEIEKLTSVKDELTDELKAYHAALEQERSKVHALQTEIKKIQASRKDRRDSK